MFHRARRAARRRELRLAPRLKYREAMVLMLALSILIGISLGLLGGGGSTLTVPILAYVGGLAAPSAIASSLFVVGVTSALGVISHACAGRVRWRAGAGFGVAGMAGAYLGGRLAAYLPGRLPMVLFGLMMIAIAIAMLRRPRRVRPPAQDLRVAAVIAEGLSVGVLTGIVGAGGGFLVVPALVLLGGLSMETAVGTSLVVIALQSFAGLAGRLGHVDVDWPLTLCVTAAAVVGSYVGARLGGRVPPAALRRGFGALLLAMAALVLVKELA